MILEEFDTNRNAIVNPFNTAEKIEGFPKVGISCFSVKLVKRFIEIFDPKQISTLNGSNGEIPVYEIEYKGVKVAFYMSRVGASACVINYEEACEKGLEKLILFGTCGVLDKEITDLSVIIPEAAIRDEGTSYHYIEANDEISVNDKYVNEFKEILETHNYSYTTGKVWTTDAPYRETYEKMNKRKDKGCICVDMECSAMAAVAKFRNKELFQFFYAADNLDSTNWDMRSLGCDEKLSEKEKNILLALELAAKIGEIE